MSLRPDAVSRPGTTKPRRGLSLSLSLGRLARPADVAQLVAHPTCNRAVRGSSPLVGSTTRPGPLRIHGSTHPRDCRAPSADDGGTVLPTRTRGPDRLGQVTDDDRRSPDGGTSTPTPLAHLPGRWHNHLGGDTGWSVGTLQMPSCRRGTAGRLGR